jgi:hypothetical protein
VRKSAMDEVLIKTYVGGGRDWPPLKGAN